MTCQCRLGSSQVVVDLALRIGIHWLPGRGPWGVGLRPESLDRRGAELLFQVLTEREERSAIGIASNEPFSGWTKTFTDPRLCAAIVDRLTFAGQIIETGTTSYRLAHARHARSSGASSSRPTGAKSG